MSAGRAGRVSWALFDWAQQPYNALVVGFIFGPWFVAGFIGDPVRGQALYGAVIAVTGVLIAALSPVAGAMIDARQNPKTWLGWLAVPFVIACCTLWFAAPGATHLAPLIMAALVIASLSTELSINAANTMLPYVAQPGRLGRLSGWSFGLGYFAALASILLVLSLFAWPEQPALGLDRARGEDDRIVGPLAALWYVVFVLPLFLFVPRAPAGRPSGRPMAELWRTLKDLPRNRTMRGFLIGRMLVNDGTIAAGAFGPVLAAGLFGWTTTETGIYGLLLALVAGISSWLAGGADDKIGSKKTMLFFAALLGVAVLGFGMIEADRLFFFFPVEPPVPGDDELFASMGERLYLLFGVMIGAAWGPVGAVSRSWMARLSPPGEEGRWFGLYAFSGRATSFAAPAMIAGATALWGDQRVAIPVVLLFLIAGAIVLLGVPGDRESDDRADDAAH